jgi:uncharacterized metal-binding protein YceD (DUF177 family)
MELERRRGEFSRFFPIDQLGSEPQEVSVSATAEERAALAQRFSLLAVDELSARLRLARVRGGGVVRLQGSLDAEIVQSCVVTLEPIRSRLAEEFGIDFIPPAEAADAREVELHPFEEESEPLTGDGIDLGEVVAEQMGLSLNPYPRRPGVSIADYAELPLGRGVTMSTEEAPPPTEAEHPFAALRRLKK